MRVVLITKLVEQATNELSDQAAIHLKSTNLSLVKCITNS